MHLRTNEPFRRLLLGQLVTNVGDSLYLVATLWLVFVLSGSTLYTGLAGFLLMLPQALQFLTGPLVDRWPARWLLVAVQAVEATVIAGIVVVWAAGHLSVWLLLVAVPLLSLLNQFVYPTLQAALPRLVPREQLSSANAAFAFAYQGVDMAFNAIGGVLIAAVGGFVLYVVDAATFLVAMALFATVAIPAARPADPPDAPEPATADPAGDLDDGAAAEPAGYWVELRGGVDFVRGPTLVPMIGTTVVANFAFGVAFGVVPAFADVRGGATLFGLLMAAFSGGILLGALVAPRLAARPFGRLEATLFPAAAVCWVGAIASPWPAGTVALTFLAAIPIGQYNVAAQTIRQLVVPDGMLGRVSSVSASAAGLATPFGALLGGVLGEAIGIDPTMATVALGMGFIALAYLAHPGLRGLPPVAAVAPADLGIGTDASLNSADA